MTSQNKVGRGFWPREWDKLPDPGSSATAAQTAEMATIRLDQMLNGVRTLVSRGRLRAARRTSLRVLASDTAKLAALVRVARRREVAASPAELIQIARGQTVWRETSAPPLFWSKLKSTGGYRLMTMLPWIDEAMGQLAMKVERASSLPSTYRLSGSTRATIKLFQKHLPTSELIITVDVPNCFGSHKHSAIESGSILPGRVLKARSFDILSKAKVLSPLSMGTIISDDTLIVQNGLAGTGIPSGVALSAALSEKQIGLLGTAVEGAAPGVRFFHQSDNLIMFLPNAKDRGSIEKALVAAVQNLFGPGTSAELFERIRRYGQDEKILFCGSWYSILEGEVVRSLDEARIANKVERLLVDIGDAVTLDELKTVERKALGWFSQSPKGKSEVTGLSEILIHVGEAQALMKDVTKKS